MVLGLALLSGEEGMERESMNLTSLRILIADDHAAVRKGLIQSFQNEADVEIVGEAQDGRAAVDLAKELSPDVVIMDITMPRLNGIDATRQIAKDCPTVKIVGLSVHASRKYANEMLEAGAVGYVLKDDDFTELVKAVRTVCDGGTYVSSAITKFGF
jgi:DNA-binding NarL/FixJ family response regulator